MNTWLLATLAAVIALGAAYWRGRRDGREKALRIAFEAASKAVRRADDLAISQARESAAAIERQAGVDAGKSAAQSPIDWANDPKWRQ